MSGETKFVVNSSSGRTGIQRDELGSRIDADFRSSPAFKFHHAVDQRKDRVIPSQADIKSRVKFRAPLADQDTARTNTLSAESLHAKILGIAVSPITGRPAAFFRCHWTFPLPR